MKKEHIYVKSNCDGLKLYTSIFVPDKPIRGIVQISHGMVEHQVYYYDLMKFLAKVGYVAVIHDHRGHGKSVWNDQDLGYFYEEKADYIVDDMVQITRMIKDRYPKVPVYLFGHSMGSLVARKYLKKYDREVKKVILCGSPSINGASSFGKFLCKAGKIWHGDRYRSKFLNRMVLPKPKSNWLSINEEYVNEYKEDKYCGYIFTINGFINLMQLMCDVYSKKGWKLDNPNMDILFIAGEKDPITKGEKKFLKSVHFLEKIGYNHVSYKLFYGCKHVVFKDKPDEVYAEILEFLEN